jgi:NAD(P)-dependent dehydrogenase (short-subunit alcohol dehydrogenase family)
VQELTAAGARAAYVRGDLGTRESVRVVAESAVAVFGEPDILVNSAGINLRPPLPELGEGVWDATMAVNLMAPFLLGQRFGPGMAERGSVESCTSAPNRRTLHSSTVGRTECPREGWRR